MSGRSRGRARTSTVPQPTPITPTAGASQPTPPSPAVPSLTTRVASPHRAPVQAAEQTGRGRGISQEPPLATQAAIKTGTVSPTSRSSGSGESPPQQASPPHPIASTGRAALRGAYNQPGAAGVIDQMSKLALEGTGDVAAREEYRIEQVFYTKPPSCTETVGKIGTPIKILCNYFEIISSPNWILHQYHVDFAPVIDSKRMRIALLKNHDALFPENKAFDGSTLYSLTLLKDELTEVASRRETDGEIITIKIKKVAEIIPTSPNFVHLFNLVFRRCLKLYGMKQIDRNFYDMKNKINIEQYRLELINGFSTAIASYENKLLLCAELTHKLLHKTTVFDVMGQIYDTCQSEDRFREKCTAELVGRVVMTKYNDKTYKINDIDWAVSPRSAFETTRGEITFVDYYKSV